MAAQLQLNERTIGGVRIVHVNGRNLDRASCGRLGTEWIEQLKTGTPLLLNLADVDFADTIGLGMILDVERAVGAQNFGIVGVSERLARCMSRMPKQRHPQSFDDVAQGVAVLLPKDTPGQAESKGDRQTGDMKVLSETQAPSGEVFHFTW